MSMNTHLSKAEDLIEANPGLPDVDPVGTAQLHALIAIADALYDLTLAIEDLD